MRIFLFASCLFAIATAQTWRKLPADALRQPGGLQMALSQACALADNESLGVPDTVHSPGGSHLCYAQYRAGVKVHGAMAKATLDREGRLFSLADATCHLPTASGSWATDPARMHIRYLRALGATRVTVDTAWVPRNDSLVPAWVLTTFQPGTVASYEIIVDARTGGEISREDRGVHFCIPSTCQSDTSGKGRIFRPDPLTVSGTVYGAPFTDANDQHLAPFDAVLDTVDLKDITLRNGFFRLEGPYVKMKDLSLPFDSVAKSASGNFYFTRDQQAFEDVMVYYHADTFQRYIQLLGFTNLQNNPFTFDAHGYDNQDNSQFVPDGQNSYIRFGDGGVDDAEDADVIIHEYGHALSYAASPGTNSGYERRGLDEGIGDYLAASYSKSLNLNAWAQIYTWDGHNEFWSGREVNVTYPYSGSLNNFYKIGSVWATMLMRVEARLGQTITMKLALQELYANVASQSMYDAAHHLLDADTLLFGGAHAQVLLEELCTGELLPLAICETIGVEPPGPTAGRGNSIQVAPNPASGSMFVSGLPAAAALVLVDCQGREVMRTTANGPEAQMPLEKLPAGMYLLRVETGGQTTGIRVAVTGER